jgi:hypothetical protein
MTACMLYPGALKRTLLPLWSNSAAVEQNTAAPLSLIPSVIFLTQGAAVSTSARKRAALRALRSVPPPAGRSSSDATFFIAERF